MEIYPRARTTDPGFDYSVLSEFRTRLIAGWVEHLLLETMLTYLQERGLLKARGKQRTDPTHILATIRTLNRLELIGETMRSGVSGAVCLYPSQNRTAYPDGPDPRLEVFRAARQRQRTVKFKEQYAKRAGIEGTLSQDVRAFDLRRSHSIGLAKTHLQHILIVAAINLVRHVAWLTDPRPQKRRAAPFAALAFAA